MDNLFSVGKVVETISETEVNKLLEDGWVLIECASGVWSDTREVYTKYTLGKNREASS